MFRITNFSVFKTILSFTPDGKKANVTIHGLFNSSEARVVVLDTATSTIIDTSLQTFIHLELPLLPIKHRLLNLT